MRIFLKNQKSNYQEITIKNKITGACKKLFIQSGNRLYRSEPLVLQFTIWKYSKTSRADPK